MPAPRKARGIFLSFLRVLVDTLMGREEYLAMNTRMDTVEHDVAELKLAVRAIEQRLDDVLPTLATKADLEKLRADLQTDLEKPRSDMLKWFFAGWVTMFFSLAGLQITLFNLAKP